MQNIISKLFAYMPPTKENKKAKEEFIALLEAQILDNKKKGLFKSQDPFLAEFDLKQFENREVLAPRSYQDTESLNGFSCDIEEIDTWQIILQNGVPLKMNNSFIQQKEGMDTKASLPIVCSLTEARELYPVQYNTMMDSKRPQYSRNAKPEKVKSRSLLNKCLCDEGLFILIPKGCELEKPLQIIHLCSLMQKSFFVQNRLCIYVEEGAKFSLIQCTDSDQKVDIILNALTQIHLEARASLNYVVMQNVNNHCHLYNGVEAKLGREAHFESFLINLNGGKVYNEQDVDLLEDASRADLFGLYLVDKDQQIGNTLHVNHWAPRTESTQLFKGILDESSLGDFLGHVYVDPKAQKTQAFQNNRNLLLSSKAQFNTKPYLEIYADDVKCSHGATVGQLSDEALFYLRARGIDQDKAKRLLMLAFTAEISSKIGMKKLRDKVEQVVKLRLSGQLAACEQCFVKCSQEDKIC